MSPFKVSSRGNRQRAHNFYRYSLSQTCIMGHSMRSPSFGLKMVSRDERSTFRLNTVIFAAAVVLFLVILTYPELCSLTSDAGQGSRLNEDLWKAFLVSSPFSVRS